VTRSVNPALTIFWVGRVRIWIDSRTGVDSDAGRRPRVFAKNSPGRTGQFADLPAAAALPAA
jgi:hypothetical protein